ncbi:MAG: ABC transporter substrate-binding protein [Acidimicrobiia bacterium]|nr:ABC transporter substrate-binding protein [Acidimicrobiia bacterium]
MRTKFGLILFVVLAMVAAACGGDDEGGDGGSGSCDLADLNLVEDGFLTIATSDPAFPPWIGVGDDNFNVPESKSGFEGDLAYKIANALGFTDDQVKWTRVGFIEAIAVGPKDFDFNVQQYSINPAREEVIDFSVPYYTTTQALVTLADSEYASASTVADLKGAKLGAQIGTTSLAFIEDVIEPDTQPNVYDDNTDVEAAMNAGQIEGLVVDLPTAYFVTAAQVDGSVIAGKFEAEAAAPDDYGLLFESGNSLKACVDEVIEDLRSDGTLDALVARWLEQGGDINVITG